MHEPVRIEGTPHPGFIEVVFEPRGRGNIGDALLHLPRLIDADSVLLGEHLRRPARNLRSGRWV